MKRVNVTGPDAEAFRALSADGGTVVVIDGDGEVLGWFEPGQAF